ncbi:hypothetical protein [Enterobacter phage 03_vB_Eclo_IJM]|nr:hypothetical protein [Enterobacter phage 03_vB_Eclo_IJM]
MSLTTQWVRQSTPMPSVQLTTHLNNTRHGDNQNDTYQN